MSALLTIFAVPLFFLALILIVLTLFEEQFLAPVKCGLGIHYYWDVLGGYPGSDLYIARETCVRCPKPNPKFKPVAMEPVRAVANAKVINFKRSKK